MERTELNSCVFAAQADPQIVRLELLVAQLLLENQRLRQQLEEDSWEEALPGLEDCDHLRCG